MLTLTPERCRASRIGWAPLNVSPHRGSALGTITALSNQFIMFTFEEFLAMLTNQSLSPSPNKETLTPPGNGEPDRHCRRSDPAQ
jgi:hypothetical protein